MEHTKSSGGNTTIEGLEIDPGYWRATKTSRKVLACYNTEACKGGVTGAVDYCRAGYEGPCETSIADPVVHGNWCTIDSLGRGLRSSDGDG